jgi:hypothetical protein
MPGSISRVPSPTKRALSINALPVLLSLSNISPAYVVPYTCLTLIMLLYGPLPLSHSLDVDALGKLPLQWRPQLTQSITSYVQRSMFLFSLLFPTGCISYHALGFLFVHCVTVFALPVSTFLRPSPQRNLVPPLSLLHVVTATLYALSPPSRTTLTLTLLFLLLLPSLPILLRLANPKIYSSTISFLLSPTFGLPPCSLIYWATASTLVVPLSFCLPEFLLKSLPLPGAGHLSLSYSTDAV